MKKRIPGNGGFTIGELIVVFLIVSLTIFLAFPFIGRIHARWEKGACAGNMREIGMALYVYARENRGKFPPSLKTLYDEQYLADARFMDCPGTKHAGTPEDPDYIYTAGLSVKDPSREVLVRDKGENHTGGGENLLYVNGDVLWKEKSGKKGRFPFFVQLPD